MTLGTFDPGRCQMGSGTNDKARGRVEEAVGALTDDPELKRRGRVNQTAGKVKDATDKVVDTVRDTLNDEPTRRR
jgi:uncharacterized protein YjbJ (UPF0337 family)